MAQTLDRFRSSTAGWLRGTIAGWVTMVLCLVGVGLVIVLAKWVRNLTTTYEITDDRLLIHRGIFVKSIDEIEHYRVKDLRLNFSLVNQWGGIATITLTSIDETTGSRPFVIPDIEQAKERRERLRVLVNAARQLRGVREFDMVQESEFPS